MWISSVGLAYVLDLGLSFTVALSWHMHLEVFLFFLEMLNSYNS